MNNFKSVFHIDEQSKWKTLLRNLSNVADAVDISSCAIEVVINSEAVTQLIASEKDETLSLISNLAGRGIVFKACNNALKSNNITPAELPSFIIVVPVGVLEIITLEMNGYAYIKP